jgi:hypothetical protein
VSFRDRLRAWFKGETKRRKAPSKSASGPSSEAIKDLEEFLHSRDGVEGYVEPRTAIYSTTLLLVAADGEYVRRPVRDRDQAESLCKKQGAPLYDAAKVGYPRRMRDFDRGIRRDTVRLEDLPPWPSGEEAPSGEVRPRPPDAPEAAEAAEAPDPDEGPPAPGESESRDEGEER